MTRFGLSVTVCIVLVFCAVTVIASPAQTLTTLYSFNGSDGQWPYAGLIQASDSNFYGTTFSGGANNDGTVFKMSPNGTLTALHNFDRTDGAQPANADLIQASDGNFYGTTDSGGASGNCSGIGGCGTVFKITPSGTLTTLYNFGSQSNCADGAIPEVGLIQATDGNFYGATYGGGNGCPPYYYGTIFKITPSGTLSTIYKFCSSGGYPCPDGENPNALTQGADGNFYGTTMSGGASNGGTVFKITPSGTLTTLHSFAGTDGATPSGALVLATDGNFYGTTQFGGTSSNCSGGCGTVFNITPSGTLTTLHSFNSADGALLIAGLIQASDGNFYGTTALGGTSSNCTGGCGTVFNITPRGTLTTLHSFNGTDGSEPYAGLIQGSDGNFYGTTVGGGAYNNCAPYTGCGTVFSLSVGIVLSPVQFVAVTPCRLADTRTKNGGSGPIQGGTFEFFNLPQLAPGKGCADLSSAVAYSLNVTVVPQGAMGYLTVWPAGRNQPVVSTMNSLDGRIKANAAIVPGGASEAISVYASNTTDVVLDIDGYFAPPSGATLAFYPLTPCRVLDTRNPNGPLGGPYLSSGVERDFPVLSSSCNIPSSAQAYSMNFTVVPYQSQSLGYLTVWPQGGAKPVVSTLNNLTATIVANGAIVPAGTNGGIATYPSGNTDLVVDIDGYFAPAGTGGLSLYPTAPCRVIDTRKIGNGQPFSGELTVDVVDSVCAPPSNAQAYVFNATVVPVGGLGYLTLWPDSQGQPKVSTLNAIDGAITSNMAIVPNINGKTDAYASGITQLILDISSYFAP